MTKRGTGNLSLIISSVSSRGACSSWANACKDKNDIIKRGSGAIKER